MKSYFGKKSLKKFIFSKFLRRRALIFSSKKNLYNSVSSKKEIINFQIKTFNFFWKKACENHEFYKLWQEKHNLPKEINSLYELNNFPRLTKEIIQENEKIILSSIIEQKSVTYVSTGGSTGQPVLFPSSHMEKNVQYGNTALGRYWWGINPFDKTFLLWGHSHLFGSGFKGKFKQIRRKFFDIILRIYRFNAYDQSESTLLEYAHQYNLIKPTVIIGYTSAIFRLAQFAKLNNINLKQENLVGVIVTAESVTESDINLINAVFGKPVIIEYGMAEVGVIGYSRKKTEACQVFWENFICTNTPTGLTISTIYDRVFPLINYQTDDIVTSPEIFQNSILSFRNISGRIQENLSIWSHDRKDLFIASGILIVHILKSLPGVLSIVSAQRKIGEIQVYIESLSRLSIGQYRQFLVRELNKEFGPVDPKSILISFDKVDNQTLAGKRKSVINIKV